LQFGVQAFFKLKFPHGSEMLNRKIREKSAVKKRGGQNEQAFDKRQDIFAGRSGLEPASF
jgi:hypothetical protein